MQPVKLNQDNKSTIFIALNPVRQQRTKHMDLRFRFIEEHIRNKEFELIYCSTADMVADILTKPLPPKQFERLRDCLGLASLDQLQKGQFNSTTNLVLKML